MQEQRLIIDRWRRGDGLILVTLVCVQGSSYRRPGARLLICKDGSYEGSISAGCLESDLLRKATWLSRRGATVERYSTLFDDATEMPFGLGCGGVLDVLLESVETPECHALMSAMELTLGGQEHLVATWLPTDGSSLRRAVFRADGKDVFFSDDLPAPSLEHARLASMRNADVQPDKFLVERLKSPQRLFIFGAGDDAKPLATMAALMGWRVTVSDGRRHLTRRERFPDTNIEIAESVESAIVQVKHQDAAVIMTHSFEQDRECLTALLTREPRYLGLLGARQRSALLISEAASRMCLSLNECCERLSAPTGLDLGGEGPEAIALAILSEAQATCNGKSIVSRKLSAGLIEGYLEGCVGQQVSQLRCGLDLV